MDFKTIIFDLDGTLIHSAPDLHAAVNHALHGLNRAPLDLLTVTSFVGNGVEMLVRRALDTTGDADDDLRGEALQNFMSYYEKNTTTLTRPYEGVVDVLEELRSSGFALGICTNKPTHPARKICDALELTQFFDVVCGAEPEVAKKPDARPLLNTMSLLNGVAEATLYVGDSQVDRETALNAGIPFRFYTGGYHNGHASCWSIEDGFDDWTTANVLGA